MKENLTTESKIGIRKVQRRNVIIDYEPPEASIFPEYKDKTRYNIAIALVRKESREPSEIRESLATIKAIRDALGFPEKDWGKVRSHIRVLQEAHLVEELPQKESGESTYGVSFRSYFEYGIFEECLKSRGAGFFIENTCKWARDLYGIELDPSLMRELLDLIGKNPDVPNLARDYFNGIAKRDPFIRMILGTHKTLFAPVMAACLVVLWRRPRTQVYFQERMKKPEDFKKISDLINKIIPSTERLTQQTVLHLISKRFG